MTYEPSKEAVERAAVAIRDLDAGCAGDIPNCGASCWCMAAARTALIAGHEPAPAPQGWEPIETAPKDGTLVQLLVLFSENSLEEGGEVGVDNSKTFIATHWQPIIKPPE